MLVSVPVEVFQRKPVEPPALRAKLWVSPRPNDKISGRAVLLLQSDDELAGTLNDAGFNVLELGLRSEAKSKPKVLLEDVQSGVVFLKTDARVHASRVSIVAEGVGAKGAVQYAGASRQMAFVVDALALLTTDKDVPLGKVAFIPTRVFSSRKMKKNILEFLLKPKNERHS